MYLVIIQMTILKSNQSCKENLFNTAMDREDTKMSESMKPVTTTTPLRQYATRLTL